MDLSRIFVGNTLTLEFQLHLASQIAGEFSLGFPARFSPARLDLWSNLFSNSAQRHHYRGSSRSKPAKWYGRARVARPDRKWRGSCNETHLRLAGGPKPPGWMAERLTAAFRLGVAVARNVRSAFPSRLGSSSRESDSLIIRRCFYKSTAASLSHPIC